MDLLTTLQHILQINTAHAKAFPACSVFTSRFLATAYNNGDFSALRAQVLFLW
jgi:hypothetical protein